MKENKETISSQESSYYSEYSKNSDPEINYFNNLKHKVISHKLNDSFNKSIFKSKYKTYFNISNEDKKESLWMIFFKRLFRYIFDKGNNHQTDINEYLFRINYITNNEQINNIYSIINKNHELPKNLESKSKVKNKQELISSSLQLTNQLNIKTSIINPISDYFIILENIKNKNTTLSSKITKTDTNSQSKKRTITFSPIKNKQKNNRESTKLKSKFNLKNFQLYELNNSKEEVKSKNISNKNQIVINRIRSKTKEPFRRLSSYYLGQYEANINNKKNESNEISVITNNYLKNSVFFDKYYEYHQYIYNSKKDNQISSLIEFNDLQDNTYDLKMIEDNIEFLDQIANIF